MIERKLWWLRIVGLLVAGVIAVVAWQGTSERELVVTILNVGQGDAIFIRTPGGNDILIDGGPDGRVVEALQRHLPPSDRTLELVVLTHPDLDHVGGLPDVAERFQIERVLETSVRTSSTANRRWERAIADQGSTVIDAQAGNEIRIDDVKLKVLWPTTGPEVSTLPTNETSVVILLEYREVSLLLTGDAGAYVEERLGQLKALPDVDVLKVGHHGAEDAGSLKFLQAVSPQISIVSVNSGNIRGACRRDSRGRG